MTILGGEVPLTIHIPKWVIGIVVVIAVGALAFLLGRSSSSDPDASEAAAGGPPCVGALGLKALARDGGEEFLRYWHSVPYEASIADFFSVERFECADLDGDGSREMIVQLVAGASGGTTPWAVLKAADKTDWRPIFLRRGSGAERIDRVSNVRVTTITPSYAIGDPLCCPTGTRKGVVRFTDSGLRYRPQTGTTLRSISVGQDGSSDLGGVDLGDLTPHDATQVFGLPSAVIRDNELCETVWADIGLTINFANLGGDNPCAGQGAVGSVDVEGPEAKHAGWHTAEGLRIGMSIERMLRLYPKAQTSQYLRPMPEFGIRGRGYSLKTKPSVIGEGDFAPSLIARIVDGTVIGIQLPVGAAGE